jgi:hypothetical protein
MSLQQKQKSIDSLHECARKQGIHPILEISSKSPDELGIKLSAFNLQIVTKKLKKTFSVEVAFQASKVFDNGGPYYDLLGGSSREAKKDPRIKSSGNLKKFEFYSQEFPIKPRTFFYDWLYVNALCQNENLAHGLLKYEGFTDIEFNPKKSINCQAYSAALYVSLYKHNLLEKALVSPNKFKNILQESYVLKDTENAVQGRLF